jgi:dTMP kinase
MTNRRSLFVAFEGIDNAGKTTLIEDVQRALSALVPVHITKELTTPIGQLLLSSLRCGSLDLYQKTLLFAADRQQRLLEGFAGHLEQEALCVADRWVSSAIAYRCAEEPSIRQYVEQVNRIFATPDLTVLIDIPATVSIARGKPLNKNNYPEEYLERVRAAYGNLARERRFVVINGTEPYSAVRAQTTSLIKDQLAVRGLIKPSIRS